MSIQKPFSHPLLDQDCCLYLKSMIIACDKMAPNIKNFHSFFKYWNKLVQKNPSPKNAFLYAFKYFNSEENKGIDKETESKAKQYLTDLRFHYKDLGLVGESIQNFIGSFQDNQSSRTEIKAEDINWFPEDNEKDQWTNQEHIHIANIFCFAWNVARFWQLLDGRSNSESKSLSERRSYLIQIERLKNFLGILKNDSKSIEHSPSSKEKIPERLTSCLKNTNPEETEFFDTYLGYFSPEYLTQDEMCSFWKKASFSSVFKKSVKTALKKPLDSIWLLARFYCIHAYKLDFFNAKRGFKDKAFKQISNTFNPDTINKIKEIHLEKYLKKENNPQFRWGNNKISLYEACATIWDEKKWKEIENLSKQIDEQYESNPYKKFLEKALPFRKKGTLLNNFDFSNRQLRTWFSKEPKKFNTLIILLSLCEFFKRVEDEDLDILQDFIRETNLATFEINLILSQGMEHEKNLFLVATNDIDQEFLEFLFKVLAIIALCLAIRELWKDTSNSSNSKEIA